MVCAVSQLKDHVAYGWTSKGDLWHVLSPVAVVPPWGEYYPRLCTREQFEKLVLVDVLLEQTQGGLALASNSYGYGAYSDPIRPVIPIDSAHPFRRKAPTHSD